MTTVLPEDGAIRKDTVELADDTAARLMRFHRGSRFASRGGVMTDLDGTAVLERKGKVYVAEPVAKGLKALADQGRAVALNTLRFPLNVIRTFGHEWSAITDAALPLVSLNGSVVGLLTPIGEGETTFEPVVSFPIPEDEIEEMIEGLRLLQHDGVDDIVLFHYAPDWRSGETIWTPRSERIEGLRTKYLSASAVISTPLESLRDTLLSQGACMFSLLVDVPEDRRMAYQHANPSRFITAPGVDKLSGAHEAARRFGFDLEASVGAGDTPMDTFLAGVGLAFLVGPTTFDVRGLLETVRLDTPLDLGAALFALAQLQQERVD